MQVSSHPAHHMPPLGPPPARFPCARAFALAGALCAAGAQAQMVGNTTDVSSYATVLVANGRQDACGMRFAGSEPATGDTSQFGYAWDLDLRVKRGPVPGQLVGLVRAELARVPALGPVRVPLKVRETWFLQEGTPFSRPLKAGTAGEDGNASTTSYESGVVLKALADAANDEHPAFLLGIQVDSEQATRVYRFSPKVKPADATEFIHCASALINQELGKTARGR